MSRLMNDLRDFMHGSGEGWKSQWYSCPHCGDTFPTDYTEKCPNMHLDASAKFADHNLERHMKACG